MPYQYQCTALLFGPAASRGLLACVRETGLHGGRDAEKELRMELCRECYSCIVRSGQSLLSSGAATFRLTLVPRGWMPSESRAYKTLKKGFSMVRLPGQMMEKEACVLVGAGLSAMLVFCFKRWFGSLMVCCFGSGMVAAYVSFAKPSALVRNRGWLPG
ncbi:hypothetical protein L7F22_061391 [Adiantum nelumboides]|nr:hypothetical protein [Adiantum nelumboides]